MPLASTKTRQASVGQKELRRVFKMSTALVDLVESILEDTNNFKQEFTRGLRTSLKQVKKGNVKKIESLSDLR
ncbi:hypothetical protein HY734_01015 [Candidatus Uhrbacteria bacterium]|nr:hypothetical protein [Candidatus Uhrbacteria bacterium]